MDLRVLVNVTQEELDLIQSTFKTLSTTHPQGWFKEDANGKVDMRHIGQFTLCEMDGNSPKMETVFVQHQYKGIDCYDDQAQPVGDNVQRMKPDANLTDVYVINYDKAVGVFGSGTPETQLQAVEMIEKDENGDPTSLAGVLSNPNSFSRIRMRSHLIRQE